MGWSGAPADYWEPPIQAATVAKPGIPWYVCSEAQLITDSASKPTVVFVEHDRWGTFAQLAAAVRRAGGRTVRVTLQRDAWYYRLADRFLFDRSLYLDDQAQLAHLAQLLDGERIVDVHCTEYVLEAVGRGDAATLPAPTGPGLAQRTVLLDKFTVGELSAGRGVRTPPKLAANRVTVAQAAAAFGLPLVVKARVGASGDMVRIVPTVADAQRAVDELSADPADLFFEKMIAGDHMDYSAIVAPDGSIFDAVTEAVAVAPGSTAPHGRIKAVDDPALIEFGRHAVEKLGITGMAHADTIRDADGRYWLIDLNLRAWGSMLAGAVAGADFVAAYLHSIGLRAQPPAPPQVDGSVAVTVFPAVVEAQAGRRRVFRAVRALLTYSWRYLPLLGPRYWFGQSLASLVGIAAAVAVPPSPPRATAG
jgi:hypothetical protein